MNEENKMYQYLLEHNYISKNESKNPLRQQELSKERGECVANKYNSLVTELETENQHLKARIEKAIEHIESNIKFCENDSQNAYDVCNIRIASDRKLLEILKGKSE